MNTSGINIETLICGPLQTNTIVISADGSESCCVIDPAEPTDSLLKYLQENGLSPEMIIITHGHGDHISGVDKLKELYPEAKFLAPEGDSHMLGDAMANLSAPFGMATTAPDADKLISGGEKLTIAGNIWEVIDTAGHSPGGISLYCEQAECCICGDSLFAGSIGRTDFPGADPELLITNIQQKLFKLPPQTVVLPGHGPATSIGAEIQSNPYVR